MPAIETSPQIYARTAGAIYLLVILFGGYSEGVVTNALIVSGDPAATAHNITAHAKLWNLSNLGNLIVPMIGTVQMVIEYLLLRPVSKPLALMFLLLNAVSLAVEAVSKLFLLMVAPILNRANGPSNFTPAQIYDLAAIALNAHNLAFHITLIFFGVAILIGGYLIFKSGYLPRLIGLLMGLAGTCYLIASFARLFAPTLADTIGPAILLPCLIGEASLCLWLLIKGVNVGKWRERLSQNEHSMVALKAMFGPATKSVSIEDMNAAIAKRGAAAGDTSSSE